MSYFPFFSCLTRRANGPETRQRGLLAGFFDQGCGETGDVREASRGERIDGAVHVVRAVVTINPLHRRFRHRRITGDLTRRHASLHHPGDRGMPEYMRRHARQSGAFGDMFEPASDRTGFADDEG